jgi:hypothetical protein
MSYRRLAALLAATSALACGGEMITTLEPKTMLTVAPGAVDRLAVGDSVVLRARLSRDEGDSWRPVRTRVSFASETPAVVSVRATSDSTATVRALAAGTGLVAVQAPSDADDQRLSVPVSVAAP